MFSLLSFLEIQCWTLKEITIYLKSKNTRGKPVVCKVQTICQSCQVSDSWKNLFPLRYSKQFDPTSVQFLCFYHFFSFLFFEISHRVTGPCLVTCINAGDSSELTRTLTVYSVHKQANSSAAIQFSNFTCNL
jgi:hypothetical protein